MTATMRIAVLLVTVLAALLPLVIGQQPDLTISPSNNITAVIALYSSDPLRTLAYTLSNPCTTSCTPATVTGVTVLAPQYSWLTLALSSAPPFGLQQLTTATITIAINSSIISPGQYNQTIIVRYLYQSQPRTQSINVSVECQQRVLYSSSVSSPYSIGVGGSVVSSIRLLSLPVSPLTVTVTPNIAYGDTHGNNVSDDSQSHGIGPLLAVSTSVIVINSTNWNRTHSFTLSSLSTFLTFGTRWSLVNVSCQTADSNLLAWAGNFTAMNVTIVETNVPGVRLSLSSSLSLVKNTGPYLLSLSLTCQPRSLVHLNLTLIDNAYVQLIPPYVIVTPTQWNDSIPVQLLLLSNNRLGSENVSVVLPSIASYDSDFDNVPVDSVNVTLYDSDLDYDSYSPNFGQPGTVITVTYDTPKVLYSVSGGSPTVDCVFGDGQYVCNTSISGYCPIVMPATIVNNHQLTCTVPACIYNSQQDRDCYSPASFHLLVNGEYSGLNASVGASVTQQCQQYRSLTQCFISPSSHYTGYQPVPSQCLGYHCAGFPSSFVYLDLPHITSVSPVNIDMNYQSSVTIVLTVLGAPPFTSDGLVSAIVSDYVTDDCQFDSDALSNSTYPASVALRCQTPVFSSLLGSTATTQLSLLVSMNNQSSYYSANSVTLLGTDSITIKHSRDLTIFMVCCFIALFSIIALFFQHYCCRNCRRHTLRLTEKSRVGRSEKGPQRLIDLLEPRVKYKAKLVELDDERRREKLREERRKIDEAMQRLRGERERKAKAAKEQQEKRKQELIERELQRQNDGGVPSPSPRQTQSQSPFTKAKRFFSMLRTGTRKSVIDGEAKEELKEPELTGIGGEVHEQRQRSLTQSAVRVRARSGSTVGAPRTVLRRFSFAGILSTPPALVVHRAVIPAPISSTGVGQEKKTL